MILNEARLVGFKKRGEEMFQHRRFPRTWFLVGKNTEEALLDES